MRRSLLLLILLASPASGDVILSGDIVLSGDVKLASQSAVSFVSLADSDWGTSGSLTDLTGRIYQPVALDTVLPVDTTGWTTDTLSAGECSISGIESALDAAGNTSSTADDEIIIDMTNCTTVTGTSEGNQITIPNDLDKVILRGHASMKFQMDPGTDACTLHCSTASAGYEDILFNIGSSTPTPIQTWTWSSGFSKGSDVIGVSTAIGTDVFPDDIIELKTDDFGSATTMEHTMYYRIVCVQDNNGTQRGSDCSGVSVDNTIKLDRGLAMDYSSPTPYQFSGGNLTGLTVSHMERRGGGTYTQNVPEYVGFETFETEHTEPHAVRDTKPVFNVEGCFECWATDLTLGPWGNSMFRFAGGAHRFLVLSNDFTGPLWKPRCVMQVSGIDTSTPVEVTFTVDNTNTDCTSSSRFGGNGSTETAVVFSPDFTSNCDVDLSGNLYFYVSSGGTLDNDPSDGSVRLALYEMDTGNAVSGANCGTPSASYATNLNQYNVAATYALTGSSQIQIIDNVFHNVRVGPIWQGTNLHVNAYNYYVSDASMHVSRFDFLHGTSNTAGLSEGNHSDGPFVPYAGSVSNREGGGPIPTWYKNRGVTHTGTGAMSDQCTNPSGGSLCVEHTDLNGNSQDQYNFIGNVFTGIQNQLDFCDNDDDPSTPPASNGCESPYQLYNAYLARNLYTEETMGADDFDSNNTTTSKSDYQEGDLLDTAPAGWDGTVYPTSLLYREADLPRPWMCTESTNGLIPEIGAEFDNMAGTLKNLPAQIRHESGTCTEPPTP